MPPKPRRSHNDYRIVAVVENGKKHTQWVMDARAGLPRAKELARLEAHHLVEVYPWKRGDIAAVHVVDRDFTPVYSLRID